MTEQPITYDAANRTMKLGEYNLSPSTLSDLSRKYRWDWLPTWPTTYYTSYNGQTNQFEQAFKIVELLMAKKHIKELSVKEFTTLVKEIAATL